MYGIKQTTYAGSEERFNNVLARADRCAVAVEALSEIIAQADGKTAPQLQELTDKANSIMRAYELDGIACEVFFSKDTMVAAKDSVKQFIVKMVSMVRRVVEYFYQMAKEIKTTATRLRKRALLMVGVSSTIKQVKDLQLNNVRLFKQLNIEGEMPAKLQDHLSALAKLSEGMESVDFVLALDNIVRDVKAGRGAELSKQDFHQELLRVVRTNLHAPTRKALAATGIDNNLPNFSSDVFPGNTVLNMYVPPIDKGLSEYTAKIDTLPFNWEVKPLAVLDGAQIGAIAKIVVGFCDRTIGAIDLVRRINALSREVEHMSRIGKGAELAPVIRTFLKTTSSPDITCTRLALTVMSRSITYCEASAAKVDKTLGS